MHQCRLINEGTGVRTVFSLQEDSDMDWFSLDIRPIQAGCAAAGIAHLRHPIRDFDPFSLRRRLPGAVAKLMAAADANGGTAYVHCTAGLGRAPATALAYMWWVKGIPLDEAYDLLTGIRPCKPKVEAIRAATTDLLYGGPPTPVTIGVWRSRGAESIQVAGLDVGWGQQVEMQRDAATRRFVLKRELPPGLYQYKLIVVGLGVGVGGCDLRHACSIGYVALHYAMQGFPENGTLAEEIVLSPHPHPTSVGWALDVLCGPPHYNGRREHKQSDNGGGWRLDPGGGRSAQQAAGPGGQPHPAGAGSHPGKTGGDEGGGLRAEVLPRDQW
jgi:hypothetical protein